MRPSVAAGHPATAAAGIEILADGGTAADAAVAAALASCVAETVMTGLLGGAHAIVWDGSRARNLDCFVAVPSGSGPMVELAVPFGEETVRYSVGPASCAVPGLPAGLDALWREHGRLPWTRLVEPALALARAGTDLPPRHAACLAMLEPVMTLNRGADLYAPDGRLLCANGRLEQPGLVAALEVVTAEGAASVYRGTIAESLLGVDGVVVTRDDLSAYEALWREPAEVHYAGTRFLTRGGLSGVPELLPRLPRVRGLPATDRVLALVDVLDDAGAEGHTTNLSVADGEGRAVVLTSSLGLGSGDFLPGLDLHLNSMLGEHDLVTEPLEPGARMQSMMAPSVALDGDGLALAIGSAGGTRLRTALCTVAAGVLDEGLEPQAAVDRPRFHPAGGTINAEPGVDEAALERLEAAGRPVRRWPDLHHYFGGTSLVSRRGPAADPRRDGAALEL
ncbi:MAG TPA: gamma-glutamyltransferase [Gaiellaceae bacterium]|nr:gamma-glutamyltransferase [Gaiellaceae bacterium]